VHLVAGSGFAIHLVAILATVATAPATAAAAPAAVAVLAVQLAIRSRSSGVFARFGVVGLALVRLLGGLRRRAFALLVPFLAAPATAAATTPVALAIVLRMHLFGRLVFLVLDGGIRLVGLIDG